MINTCYVDYLTKIGGILIKNTKNIARPVEKAVNKMIHLALFKYLYLQKYDSYTKDKHRFEIYIKFCFRMMYFFK